MSEMRTETPAYIWCEIFVLVHGLFVALVHIEHLDNSLCCSFRLKHNNKNILINTDERSNIQYNSVKKSNHFTFYEIFFIA